MPHILVVDHKPAIQRLLGYAVSTVSTEQAAKARCASQPFDVILAETERPMVDGHALIRWVSENYPDSHCVLMSNADDGCDDCPYSDRCRTLMKPFSPTDARLVIEEIMDRSS